MPPALTTIKHTLAFVGNLAGTALTRFRCASCEQLLRHDAVFCASCHETVVECPSRAGPAYGHYGGALAHAIHRFKYLARPDLARPLGSLLARLDPIDVDVIVPVPLHPRRLLERGYNQAALLATEMGRSRGIPVAHRALRRLRHGQPQTGLDRSQRLKNLADAFSLRQPNAVRGRRVLLIDDVRTTGATLAACSGALSDAVIIHAAVLADSI